MSVELHREFNRTVTHELLSLLRRHFRPGQPSAESMTPRMEVCEAFSRLVCYATEARLGADRYFGYYVSVVTGIWTVGRQRNLRPGSLS